MILDAYALVAYLRDEVAADKVEAVLLDPDIRTRTMATTAAEVVDRTSRLESVAAEDVAADVRQLGIELTPVDHQLGLQAGILRANAYHRTRSPLSLADCVVAAEGLRSGELVATSDPHLLDLVAAQGGSFLALPDTNGRAHSPAVLYPGEPLA